MPCLTYFSGSKQMGENRVKKQQQQQQQQQQQLL